MPRSDSDTEVRFDTPETCGCVTCANGSCCNLEDFISGRLALDEPDEVWVDDSTGRSHRFKWSMLAGVRVVRPNVDPGTVLVRSWAPQSLGQIQKWFPWVGTKVRNVEDFAYMIRTGRLPARLRRRRGRR